MVNAEVQSDILKELERLPLPKQRQVLDFARCLSERRPEGVPGDTLLRFAGIFTDEEAKEFLRASEECRKVDEDEW